MKNVFFALAFLLVGMFSFAHAQKINVEKHTIENSTNHLKIAYDLGDLSNFSDIELNELLSNLPTHTKNLEQYAECTISYSFKFSNDGKSITPTAAGTATTCKEAGAIAAAGVRSQYKASMDLIKSLE